MALYLSNMRIRITCWVLLIGITIGLYACHTSQTAPASTAFQSVIISFRNRAENIQIPIRNIAIAGTFNDWNTNTDFLNPADEDNTWTITLRLRPGNYKYMFIINGFKWVSPPDADGYIDDGFVNMNGVMEVKARLEISK